jgi:serine phosphatase RsbU (regulator of sigma subunit)
LLLEGTTVSRRHCRLDLLDGKLRIHDMGSTNGTFVDGVRLDAAAVLDDGAAIAIGAHRLRYHRRGRDETEDADALDQELREASNYVASILPKPIDRGPVRAHWHYTPSTRIGGDAFGYQMLDERRFAFFLLDVSGHGTGAAMHAMSVAQAMREQFLPNVDFGDPASVIAGLNARFPMERNNDLFFTIWYGVHDIPTRVLRFCAAGHHAAWLMPPPGEAWDPLPLETLNPVVGMLPDTGFAAAEVDVPEGATLHLFSDGVFEVSGRDGRLLGLEAIPPMLADCVGDGIAPDQPRRLFDRIRAFARPGPLEDDFSVLLLRFC